MSHRRLVVLMAAVPGLIVVLVLAAWGIDTAISSGATPRNLRVGPYAVGSLGDAELDAALERIATREAARKITVRTPAGDATFLAADLGVAVDVDATRAAIDDVGDDVAPFARPADWVGGVVGGRTATLHYVIGRPDADAALAGLVAANAQPATEPAIEAGDGGMTVIRGRAGTTLDTDRVVRDLAAALGRQGGPIPIEATTRAIAPRFGDDEAAAHAATVEDLTAAPFSVQVGTVAVTIEPPMLRRWFRLDTSGAAPVLAPANAVIAADLEQRLAGAASAPTPATFTVVDGAVRIVDGKPGARCCDANAVDAAFRSLRSGEGGAEVGLATVAHDHDRAWAESLGIKELVGEFTTRHAAGESRVTNIHRMADTVRGAIIEPGATFSINEFVGKRTKEKGYVEAGVIYNGKHDTDVGGGVSQFATTLFNAAFFAGLDYGEYQSHSLVISRYPYGREATMGFPHPDLQIRNTTPHPVLIWTSYTGSSITVQLFSTTTVTAEQTGQRTVQSGKCKKVITERTRTWIADGHTAVDTVFAIYRPSEGVNC